jgi:hypothetical protein
VRLTVPCFEPTQAHKALTAQVWPALKNALLAGHRMVLVLQLMPKSREQEEKYHAMIGEIARQAQHLGAKWEADDWKRLLLDKFARETGRTHGRVIPNLDSTGVVEVGVLSRRFSTKDANEFIEWLHAWGAESGIVFSDSRVDPETGEIV